MQAVTPQMELTSKQEDLILEQVKCEYCQTIGPKDESHRVQNDELDYIEICDSCYEGCLA